MRSNMVPNHVPNKMKHTELFRFAYYTSKGVVSVH